MSSSIILFPLKCIASNKTSVYKALTLDYGWKQVRNLYRFDMLHYLSPYTYTYNIYIYCRTDTILLLIILCW